MIVMTAPSGLSLHAAASFTARLILLWALTLVTTLLLAGLEPSVRHLWATFKKTKAGSCTPPKVSAANVVIIGSEMRGDVRRWTRTQRATTLR
jgi:hypothetical protein